MWHCWYSHCPEWLLREIRWYTPDQAHRRPLFLQRESSNSHHSSPSWSGMLHWKHKPQIGHGHFPYAIPCSIHGPALHHGKRGILSPVSSRKWSPRVFWPHPKPWSNHQLWFWWRCERSDEHFLLQILMRNLKYCPLSSCRFSVPHPPQTVLGTLLQSIAVWNLNQEWYLPTMRVWWFHWSHSDILQRSPGRCQEAWSYSPRSGRISEPIFPRFVRHDLNRDRKVWSRFCFPGPCPIQKCRSRKWFLHPRKIWILPFHWSPRGWRGCNIQPLRLFGSGYRLKPRWWQSLLSVCKSDCPRRSPK